jgi:hypothetical protein
VNCEKTVIKLRRRKFNPQNGNYNDKTIVFYAIHKPVRLRYLCVIKNKLLITFTPKIFSCLSGTIGDKEL